MWTQGNPFFFFLNKFYRQAPSEMHLTSCCSTWKSNHCFMLQTNVCPDFEYLSHMESMRPSKILAEKDVNELRFSKLSLKYTLETSFWSTQPGALVFLSCTQNLQVWKELHWQERIPLHLTDPGPIHIPSIQERAERLISRFKGKAERPPKVISTHGCFFVWFSLFLVHLRHVYTGISSKV